MKYRTGFISNSSSSNFIILLPNIKFTSEELKKKNDIFIELWDGFKHYPEYQDDITKILNATQNNQIIDTVGISYDLCSDGIEQIEKILEKCGGYLTNIGDF